MLGITRYKVSKIWIWILMNLGLFDGVRLLLGLSTGLPFLGSSEDYGDVVGSNFAKFTLLLPTFA